jgi:hypothetical protein
MATPDITLIKMLKDHYFIKRDKVVNKTVYKGKTFFDKFERVDERITPGLLRDHDEGSITIAHSLINKRDKVENIVFDYNGRNTEKFWHRAQLILREEGFLNFTAYETKTPGHLHLYIHKGHTDLQEAYQLAQKLSMKFAQKMPREWKVFPNPDIPREFNILAIPYKVYNKERGTSWAKHM